jgi:hypothetical protein
LALLQQNGNQPPADVAVGTGDENLHSLTV